MTLLASTTDRLEVPLSPTERVHLIEGLAQLGARLGATSDRLHEWCSRQIALLEEDQVRLESIIARLREPDVVLSP